MLVGRRSAPYLGLLTASGILLSVAAIGLTVLEEGTIRYQLGGWEAPLGINLYADGLAVFMLLMTAIVGAAVSAYAVGYFTSRQDESGRVAGDSGDRSGSFWVLWMFLWASLNGLFLSADAFNLYVTLEIMGLSAAGLVTLERRQSALSSGMRYLFVTLLGSLAYLMGVALLYGALGALDLATLGELMYPGAATWSALALITLGMALKTGLFPLHFWMPAAYSNAISPASALLAGLVGKASFYLLLRLWFDVFDGGLGPGPGQVLGLLGAAAIVWGAVMAVRQRRLKRLLAYSSVSQIGYLFVLFSLATTASWGFDAWSGGVYHAFSHACAKAAMFMSAGAIVRSVGHDDLDRMQGVGQQMPLAVAGFALGGVTLMGLPPTGGFTAKWLLVSASLESGQWWIAVVLLAGGVLAALYVLRFLNPALIQVKVGPVARPATQNLEVTAFVLAFGSFFLALLSAPLLALLRIGTPFASVLLVGTP
ncbi:MAG: oxidoreductase [Rubrobacter sp.]|nr:oxidoreductase [Rubrobacter sp.]